MEVKVQSCPTPSNPMDCIVHRILQARILEWVAFPFSRGSSQPRDQTQVSHIPAWFFYQLNHKGSPRILEWVVYPFSGTFSQPRNQTGVSCIAGRFFTNWAIREALLSQFNQSEKVVLCLPTATVLTQKPGNQSGGCTNLHVRDPPHAWGSVFHLPLPRQSL